MIRVAFTPPEVRVPKQRVPLRSTVPCDSALRVIGFFTAGTAYEEEAKRLRWSLSVVGMNHYIVAVPPARDWNDAVAVKASVIRMARDRFPGGLLYIDVDAIVHENCCAYFDGLEGGFDFAAHWFQGPSGGYNRERNDDWFLSGTMWFADTFAARALLDAWIARNRDCRAAGVREGGGQANLRDVINEGLVPGLRVHRLPGRYCYVFDKPWAYPPDEPVVIEHLIASRENRDPARKVNQARRERIAELERSRSNL